METLKRLVALGLVLVGGGCASTYEATFKGPLPVQYSDDQFKVEVEGYVYTVVQWEGAKVGVRGTLRNLTDQELRNVTIAYPMYDGETKVGEARGAGISVPAGGSWDFEAIATGNTYRPSRHDRVGEPVIFYDLPTAR